MSKQIYPRELVEVVAGLLLKPELLGELDTPEKHKSFMLDIGRVVGLHCGGYVYKINNGDTEVNYLSDQYSSPSLSVSIDDNLPSLLNNVWSCYDPEGWEEEFLDSDRVIAGTPLTLDVIQSTRLSLQGLLCNAALSEGNTQTLQFKMMDWRVTEEVAFEKADDRQYLVKASIGNQASLELLSDEGEPCFGLMIEINHGVPAVHIDIDGGDAILHIHAAQGGLVLTPDDAGSRFEQAELDRYSYNDKNSLVIR